MTINYSEYNNVHLPRAEQLVCFIKGLSHAMQKTADYEGAMHQLKCIGYSDELAESMCQVACDYKTYHKERIRAEQTANTVDALYPTIQQDRREQYAKNCSLIRAINESELSEQMMDRIREAIQDEIDVSFDIFRFLKGYCDRDVDMMATAITRWDLEAIFAKAQIIADTQEYFYKKEDVVPVAFPFWDKDAINVEEFKDYLLAYFDIHEDTWKLIQNAIQFAKNWNTTMAKRQEILMELLKDVISVPEGIIRMVELS